MPTCTRCLLTETMPNIQFDANGMCNHCSTYDAYAGPLRDFDFLRPLLLDRIERVRGKYAYDALVGLSGGKDSSYVAYSLVRDHGLKILLMTYDNGFLTEYARANIARIIDTLKQDHVFCRPSPEVHRAIYRSSLRLAGIPCVGCTLPGFLHAFKLAVDKNIPLLVHGRSRAQMLKGLSPGSTDPFLPMLAGNFAPYDRNEVRRFSVKLVRKLMRTLRLFVPQPSLRAQVRELFIPDLEKLRTMPEPAELVGFFLYEPYDEERIKSTLVDAIDWKRAEDDHLMGHDDCAVHAAAAYLHNVNYGHPIIRPELSTMIREGDITREKALARLEKERCAVELNDSSLQILCDMAGFDQSEVMTHARRTRKALDAIRAYLTLRNRFFPKHSIGLPISQDTPL